MGIPANVGKTVIQGTGIGSEVWQCGLWWQRSDAADMTGLAEFKLYTADLKASFDGFWAAIKSKIYTSYGYAGIKSYWYRGGPTAAFVAENLSAVSPGTAAGSAGPVDTCMVMSLRSDVAGRRGRGRIYLPRHEVVNISTGLYASDGTTYANALAALFASFITQPHTVEARVVSQAGSVARPLSSFTVDQLPDVQRRRQNRMARGTIVERHAPY